jgi:peptidoglycan lytic transglycosylase G
MISFDRKLIALLITFITVVVFVSLGWKLYSYLKSYPHNAASDKNEIVKLDIKKGSSFSDVIKTLHNKGLIKKPLFFKIYTMLKKGSVIVKAGHYRFNRNFPPKKILQTLLKGPIVTTVKVTIPPGKHMLQITDILFENGIIKSKSKFISELKNPELLKKFGIEAKNMEGYLFPETYRLRLDSTPKEVLKTFYKHHKRAWTKLSTKYLHNFRRLQGKFKFNHHKIVIMASLVEKETGVPKERPLIANVFFNRLSFKDFKPKLLQTDPTIIYGCTVPEVKSEACKKFKGKIRFIHLRDKHNPYNTYTVKGLPPGPICNPGIEALKAVFKPSNTKYLYFVAKTPGGEHYFSKTFKEHNRAVDKYIRNKKN